jgi:inositol-phosphate transport system substrate-binding protein
MPRMITRREFVTRSAAIGAGLLSAPALGCTRGSDRTEVELRAWSQVTPIIDVWRTRALRAAVPSVEDFAIELATQDVAAQWPDYLNRVTLAASAGNAPHIVVAGHELSAQWAAAGWVVPLDDCRAKHDELDALFPALWEAVDFNGKRWGVPFEPEARPMFFHEGKLRELGWSQQEVDELPERLRSGTFTLDDLVHTSRLAIDKRVVPKGFAYWHRPQPGYDFLQYYVAYGGKLYDDGSKKLVVRRGPLAEFYAFQRRVVEEELTPRNFIPTDWDVWHTTVANGKTLFWNGGIWMWAEWKAKYIGGKGDPFLESFVGYGLQPTGVKGQPGRTLSRPIAYFVTSNRASGASDREIEAACALLAKSMDERTRTREALGSAHLAWLEPQLRSPAYRRDRFLSSVTYMIQEGRAFFVPNDANFPQYNTIVYDGMLQAAQGEISPATAADSAIARMKLELRDAVIVE